MRGSRRLRYGSGVHLGPSSKAQAAVISPRTSVREATVNEPIAMQP